MTKWNGKDASGKYQYSLEETINWNMHIDEAGTVYYMPKDGSNSLHVWCPASRLSSHLYRLEQIAAR